MGWLRYKHSVLFIYALSVWCLCAWCQSVVWEPIRTYSTAYSHMYRLTVMTTLALWLRWQALYVGCGVFYPSCCHDPYVMSVHSIKQANCIPVGVTRINALVKCCVTYCTFSHSPVSPLNTGSKGPSTTSHTNRLFIPTVCKVNTR